MDAFHIRKFSKQLFKCQKHLVIYNHGIEKTKKGKVLHILSNSKCKPIQHSEHVYMSLYYNNFHD